MMKNFKKYVTALAKEFIFMATGSVIAFIWLIFSIYVPKLPESVSQYQYWIFWSFMFLGFLVSTYRAWLKLYISNLGLERKIKEIENNSVQYEIRAEAANLTMDLDGILERCKINKEIAEMEIRKLSAPSSASFGIWNFNSSVNPFRTKPSIEDWQNFITQTEVYETKISEQSKMLDGAYKVRLILENTGAVYDENISIQIAHAEDCGDFDLYDSFHEMGLLFQVPPEMPREKNMHDHLFPQGLSMDYLNSERRHLEPYRTVNCLSKTGIEVELRSLRAKDKAEIVYDGFYIKTNSDKLRFDYVIRSKNTKGPIKGSLAVDFSNLRSSIDIFQKQED